MRALIVALAGALLLSACTEGVSPQAPVARPPQTGGTPPDPVSPTDITAGGPIAARPPPPAPEPEVALETLPEPVPVEGSAVATVVPSEGDPGASAVEQVDVDLTVSGVRGRGTVDVEFVAPGGLAYEKRSSSVEAAPEESRTLRFVLPVAGTAVASTGMRGTWQVRFFLDGSPLTATSFTLTP